MVFSGIFKYMFNVSCYSFLSSFIFLLSLRFLQFSFFLLSCYIIIQLLWGKTCGESFTNWFPSFSFPRQIQKPSCKIFLLFSFIYFQSPVEFTSKRTLVKFPHFLKKNNEQYYLSLRLLFTIPSFHFPLIIIFFPLSHVLRQANIQR